MLLHYLKITFRNLRKHKTQSLTGILGLAFGIACFVPAFYWLRYETTYDGFYPGAPDIYRIYSVEKESGKVNEKVPGILEAKMHDRFPATEVSTGLDISNETYSAGGTPHIRLRTLYTDSAFFRVFPQVFVCGDARQPLQTMRHIILTESVAIRMFGAAEKAIGQQVKSTLYSFEPYTVSAVVKDPPPNTNLPFEAIHFPEIQGQMTAYMPEEAQWTFFDKQMYVKLGNHNNLDALAGEMRDFTSQISVNSHIELRLLPISDVRHRLNAGLPFTLGFVRLFVAAGLLLLSSAFFNFLNLHLGLFRQRIRELRLRTVNGAAGRQIITQMMLELACATILSLFLALCLVASARHALPSLLGIAVDVPRIMNQFTVSGILVVVLMLLAGIILLWRLSRSASRDIPNSSPASQPVLRRVAVALQLAVSIVFIVAALVVTLQLGYVNRKDLGFDRHGLVQLSGSYGTSKEERAAIDHQLASIPQIESITKTSFEPQHEDHTMVTSVEWPGKQVNYKPAFQSIIADSRFAETFKLKLLQGKWWNEGDRQKIVLNEEAVRVMGLRDPVGAVIRMLPDYIRDDGDNPMQDYEVVGVVADFHTLSLRSRIYPTILRTPGFGDDNTLYIRVMSGQEQEVMQRIAAFLPGINPTLADAHLTPLDELYDRLNRSEQAGMKMFSVLAAVCLLISLFGIYAVATASTRRRRKEIAIRKVSGAEARDIAGMFFREYILMAFIAAAVALPLAYTAMNRWLQGYAYHIHITWWLLVSVMITVTSVILFTVLNQVLKAANSDPAEVVKCE